MKFLVINNPNSDLSNKVAEDIKSLFSKRGIECVCTDRDDLPSDDFNFAITVGGDGTLLHAAHLLMGREIPIVGINVGRLGFLTALTADNLERLTELIDGSYHREERITLSASCSDKNLVALNEFLFAGSSVGKTVDVSVLCDGIRVLDYRGDGVIVSTPTGSTAYSLSAGGPIIDVNLKAITVTPLCAHSLGTPPMVFSAERTITVRISSGSAPVKLCADGRDEVIVNDDVAICCSDRTTPLIFFNETGQFAAIDKKLRRKYSHST